MRDKVIAPCKGCEDRTSECHADCERYAAWVKRHRAWLDKVRKEKYPELYDYVGDRAYRGRER